VDGPEAPRRTTIQDGCQVFPSDADSMNVKGVFGKSVGANFGVRSTSPGAIGILSEIPALDLGGERPLPLWSQLFADLFAERWQN
jgi:hypothetical protein